MTHLNPETIPAKNASWFCSKAIEASMEFFSMLNAKSVKSGHLAALSRIDLCDDGKERFLAIIRGDECGLAIFSRDSLCKEAFVQWPKAITSTDFNDITIDPLTGRMWVHSAQANAAYELELRQIKVLVTAGSSVDRWNLRLLGKISLPSGNQGEFHKSDGMVFDEEGIGWMLAEDGERLVPLHFTWNPRPPTKSITAEGKTSSLELWTSPIQPNALMRVRALGDNLNRAVVNY